MQIRRIVLAPGSPLPAITDQAPLMVDQSAGDFRHRLSDRSPVCLIRKQMVGYPIGEKVANQLVGAGIALPLPSTIRRKVPFPIGFTIVPTAHQRAGREARYSRDGGEAQDSRQ